MATEAEIEAAAAVMRELDGGFMAPWRKMAQVGLEAAERVREAERRAALSDAARAVSTHAQRPPE